MISLSKKRFTLKAAMVIAPIGLALVLAAHLWVVGYTYPQADDLCFFAQAREGFFTAIELMYKQADGRVIAGFLHSMPYHFSAWTSWNLLVCYRVLLLLNLVLLFTAAVRLSRLMLPDKTITSILMASLAFTTLFLVTTFSPMEGFFWLNGLAIYIFGFLPCVITFEFGIKLLGNVSLSWLKIVVTQVALIFAGLSSELYAIAFVLFFGAVIYVLLMQKSNRTDNRLRIAILSLCLAIACFTINTMSPATHSRAEHAGILTLPGLLRAVGLGLTTTPVFLLESLSVGVLLFVLYIILEQRNRTGISQPRGVALLWAALLCTLPVSLVLGFFVTGDPLPGRALNLMHFFIIVAVTGLGVWYVNMNSFLKSRWGVLLESLPFRTASQYVFIAMAVVIIFDRGAIRAVQDALIEGPRFASAMDDRFARLQGPATEVVLPPLPQGSRLLLLTEHEYKPSGLLNGCAAQYFGKASVRLALPQD